MKYIKIAFCCLIYLIGTFTTFHNLEQAEFQYDTVSLRYELGVDKQQILQVKDYLANNIEEQRLFPTFWKEQEGTLSTDFQEVSTKTLVYLGEGYRVHHGEFLSGGYPIENDRNGCAISDALAFELFGSMDVIGQEVEFENHSNRSYPKEKNSDKEKVYEIRGVFKEEEKLALFSGELDENYTVVELVGDMKGDSEGAVTIFVGNSGLEMPDQIVYGIGIASLLELACNLPLIIVVIWLSLNSISLIQNRYPEIKEILWIFVFLLFAYNLPSLLEQIPQWILPSRWSDFTFWQSLLETMIMRIEEWFFLQVTIKDVIIKFIILKVGLLVAVQLICTYYLYSAFHPQNVKSIETNFR